MPEATEEKIETIADTPAPEKTRTTFSDALKNLNGGNGAGDDEAEKAAADAAKAKVKEPEDDSFIPDDLRTAKPEPVEDKGEQKKPGYIARLKAQLEEKEVAITTISKELEERRKVSTDGDKTAGELKAEREARAALEARLERVAFTESPKFKAFEVREADQLAGAKAAIDGLKVEDVAVDPSIIDLAARLTGAKRLAVLKDAGLDPETIATVTPYLATLDTIGREKAAALENYKGELEKWNAQERQQSEAQQKQRDAEVERLFSEVSKGIHEKIREFRKVEGQPKWNAQVDAITARANEIFSHNLPLEEVAEMAHRAAAQELTSKINDNLRAENKTLKEQVKKLTASQPGAGDARGSGGGNGTAPTPRENWNAEMAKVTANG